VLFPLTRHSLQKEPHPPSFAMWPINGRRRGYRER
jgi:hypothetical protein